MYNFHYDHQLFHWNVFDASGFYVCSFRSAQEAADFCKYVNQEVGYE
jgi:hypothetical protein